MDRQRALAVVMVAVDFGVAVAGIHQELFYVAPGYDRTIMTGWGDRLSHEEYLLVRLGGAGVVRTPVAFRWRYAAVLPAAVGRVGVGYSFVTVSHHVQEPGLCTAVQAFDGTIRLTLGAELFLLVVGGLLSLDTGTVAW